MHLYMARPTKRARLEVPERPAPVDTLPTEMLAHVFSFLDKRTLRRKAGLVSAYWCAVADAAHTEMRVAVRMRKRGGLFDLGTLAKRFPRVTRVVFANPYLGPAVTDDDRAEESSDDDIEIDSDIESSSDESDGGGAPAGARVGDGDGDGDASDSESSTGQTVDPFESADAARRVTWPVLYADRYHALRWNDALDLRCVHWATTVTRLELDNIVMPERTTWMRRLVALNHVRVSRVAFLSLRQLVAANLVGSAATLEFLAVSFVRRLACDDRVDVFDVIFGTYRRLVALRLDHFGFNRTKRARPADGVYVAPPPFVEHGALRYLQLQALDSGAAIPFHRFRLPALREVTLKAVRLSEAYLAHAFPSVRKLMIGLNVWAMKTPVEVSLWFPQLESVRIGQYGVYLDPNLVDFVCAPRALFPRLYNVVFCVSLQRDERDLLPLVRLALPAPRAPHITVVVIEYRNVGTCWLYEEMPADVDWTLVGDKK